MGEKVEPNDAGGDEKSKDSNKYGLYLCYY